MSYTTEGWNYNILKRISSNIFHCRAYKSIQPKMTDGEQEPVFNRPNGEKPNPTSWNIETGARVIFFARLEVEYRSKISQTSRQGYESVLSLTFLLSTTSNMKQLTRCNWSSRLNDHVTTVLSVEFIQVYTVFNDLTKIEAFEHRVEWTSAFVFLNNIDVFKEAIVSQWMAKELATVNVHQLSGNSLHSHVQSSELTTLTSVVVRSHYTHMYS